MNKQSIYKHSHLTLSDRIAIEQGIKDGMNFRQIADEIEKDPTTVSKEVKRAIGFKEYMSIEVDCTHFNNCHQIDLCQALCFQRCRMCTSVDCTQICNKWRPAICEKLKKVPYVCNACKEKNSCTRNKLFYKATKAHSAYERKLVESRKGINATIDEINAINDLITPLLKNRQPISHIYATHAEELGISRKTLYNYIDAGLLSIKNVDLPRKVKYKKRKKRHQKHTKDYSCRRGRTYKDFERFLENHSEIDVVEMDTVKGTREHGKCLLTMMFRSSRLMLIFLLNSCTSREVVRVFDELTELLGETLFEKTFPLILTDNGPEFKDVQRMECTEDGVIRTNIFYCDPQKSNQKSRLEKNHEYIRYIIPKGRSMYRLTPESVRVMTNHINSISRESLNNHTPYDVAKILLNKKVMDALMLEPVQPDMVKLHPSLLKK